MNCVCGKSEKDSLETLTDLEHLAGFRQLMITSIRGLKDAGILIPESWSIANKD
jgi:hypothetical protein